MPATKKVLILKESLPYISLNAYLDFVNYLNKNKNLTFDVDVLGQTDLGPEIFEQMIENAKTKHMIIQGKQSKTKTGKPLTYICDELGLKDLKVSL